MRVGAFLLGGVAGAAAVIYLNRKTNSMIFSAFDTSNDTVGKMMNKAKDTFTNQANTAMNPSQNTSKDSIHQTENVIKEDPLVSQAANEIILKTDEKSTRIH